MNSPVDSPDSQMRLFQEAQPHVQFFSDGLENFDRDESYEDESIT